MTRPILFVHGISEIGGAEQELLLIAQHLKISQFPIQVICGEPGPLLDEIIALQIPIHLVPLPSWRKLASWWGRRRAVQKLRKVIQLVQPCVIHVNDIWWVPQVLQAGKGLGCQIFGHVRQEIEEKKVQQYYLDRLDRVFAVSHQIQGSLEAAGIPQARLQTLYSGINLQMIPTVDGKRVRKNLNIPEEGFVLGTVANLFPRKGYEVMLRAWPRIVSAIPHAYYVIVGKGDSSYEQSLRSSIKQLGAEAQIHCVGFQTPIYPFLAGMDLYVHPALMEGFGIAVLEAMAMGRAVVASRVGGVPEVVADHETGWLVEPNDPEALADAIVALYHDPDRRRRYAAAGLERVTRCFSTVTMMNDLVGTYREATRHSGMPLEEIHDERNSNG